MAIQITLDQLAPEVEQWSNASDGEKRDYYAILAGEARQALAARFLAGEDRFGAPLLPVLDPKRRPGKGPPLIPRKRQSRSITLMRAKAYPDRCVIYWEDDWGDILEYHQKGIPSRFGLRVRDIGGFTLDEERQIRLAATRKWRLTTTAPALARVINQPRPSRVAFGSFFEAGRRA